MHRWLALSLIALGLGVLSGCESRDAGAASAPPAPQTAVTKGDVAGAPPLDIRKEQLRLAMRGLLYDSGRVQVDADFAAGVPERGSRSAAEAEYARGEQLYEQNAFIDAIAAFTRAVIILPEEAHFYVGLGGALDAKGKNVEAEAAFRTGLDLAPQATDLRFLLAERLGKKADLDGAIAEFRTLLSQNPQNAEAHNRLAVLFFFADDRAGAWEHVQAAEALGATVPPQFLLLLNDQMPPPAVLRGRGLVIGPQQRIDVAGGTFAANETTIATSDRAPREIVAAWNDWRRSTSQEIINMGVAVSIDAGATWTDFLVRPPAPNQSSVEGDPMTAADPRTGTLWVGAISFASNGGVYVAKKVPGSTSFEASRMARATGGADKCWMAAGPGVNDPNVTRLYIAYNEGVLRSTDMGNTWSAPVSLGGGLGFLPRVGPHGEVYVVYWNLGSGLELKRSLDGGVTFNPTPIRVATRLDFWGVNDTTRFPGQFRVPIMGYLAVDPNDGTLYFVYFDKRNGAPPRTNIDLYFTTSTNQGTTWTTPRVINTDPNTPGDQFFPWLEVDRFGRIHLCFWSSENTAQNDGVVHGMFDAYYMTSDDRGATWTEYRLTPNSYDSNNDGLNRSNQFLGDYNGLAVGGSYIYPCYLSTQNGNSDTFTNVIKITLLGDLNCDGLVNFDDINPFVLALTDPAGYITAFPGCPFENQDINGDGACNFDDINPFVCLLAG